MMLKIKFMGMKCTRTKTHINGRICLAESIFLLFPSQQEVS